MIILLFVYSLAHTNVGDARPVLLALGGDLSFCGNQGNKRTIWNITWSCLTTIFLCTWVSVHPNIALTPERHHTDWFHTWLWNPLRDFVSYKLPLFICALLVPEYILAWSIRQYFQAGVLSKKVDGWTRTHGFFMIMGGYHLFRLSDGALSMPLRSSSSSEFVVPSDSHSRQTATPVCPLEMHHLPLDVLDLVTPTEAELRDKGKSDGLSKFIVLVQTLWFIAQCIARGIQSFPLTELEVVTLAYAMMNFFIYIFWWDKPRNVECPIRVYHTLKAAQVEAAGAEKWDEGWIKGSLEIVMIYLAGYQDAYSDLSRETSVPLFWSGRPDVSTLALLSTGPSLLGATFGAIHCIAWSYGFTSHAEQVLWRISCVAIIAVPLNAALASVAERIGRIDTIRSELRVFMSRVAFVLAGILALSLWLYVVARIATLVIAFTTLRALPSPAFSVVDWTGCIPHI